MTPDGVGNTHVPFFALLLDAKLPGEDIVRVAEQSGPGVWLAAQRSGELGLAHTEVLARRIAALKAMKARSA